MQVYNVQAPLNWKLIHRRNASPQQKLVLIYTAEPTGLSNVCNNKDSYAIFNKNYTIKVHHINKWWTCIKQWDRVHESKAYSVRGI